MDDAALSLRTEIDAHLLPVLFDRHSLGQAFDCLIDNALKFAPSGGSIVVGAKRLDSGALEISVADTGIGVSPELIEEICKPFRQADSGLNRRYEGIGLGLTTVSALVRRQDTMLSIDSKIDAGTRAVLTIPAERVLDDAPEVIDKNVAA